MIKRTNGRLTINYNYKMLISFFSIKYNIIKYILLNNKHNIMIMFNKFLFKIMSLTTHYFYIIRTYYYLIIFGYVDTIKMVIGLLLISYRIFILLIISCFYILNNIDLTTLLDSFIFYYGESIENYNILLINKEKYDSGFVYVGGPGSNYLHKYIFTGPGGPNGPGGPDGPGWDRLYFFEPSKESEEKDRFKLFSVFGRTPEFWSRTGRSYVVDCGIRGEYYLKNGCDLRYAKLIQHDGTFMHTRNEKVAGKFIELNRHVFNNPQVHINVTPSPSTSTSTLPYSPKEYMKISNIVNHPKNYMEITNIVNPED